LIFFRFIEGNQGWRIEGGLLRNLANQLPVHQTQRLKASAESDGPVLKQILVSPAARARTGQLVLALAPRRPSCPRHMPNAPYGDFEKCST
jgi:phosphohistidine phosphatase SixA